MEVRPKAVGNRQISGELYGYYGGWYDLEPGLRAELRHPDWKEMQLQELGHWRIIYMR